MGRATIERYYAAFNAGDAAAMLAEVSENVEHRVNEGETRFGKTKFAEFCGHMGISYREQIPACPRPVASATFCRRGRFSTSIRARSPGSPPSTISATGLRKYRPDGAP
jgi:hypothetical protein